MVAWIASLILLAQGGADGGNEPELRIKRSKEFIAIEQGGGELLRYWLKKPEGSGLTVESAGFFHPLKTPGGITVTELAPEDHPHHRGVFLGWVEMHGAKDADFWGWGEHAPVKERAIRNQRVFGMRGRGNLAAFGVQNGWEAEGRTMVVERLQAAFRAGEKANVLDLNYRLTPSEETRLAQWAFSGFCVRTVKEGRVVAHGPDGKVDLPNPNHMMPMSDWPDAAWYAYELTLPSGEEAGVAVVNHPDNPPSLWHNHRETRMLNPCIVAPGEVELAKHKPLTLRYRVVLFDGAVPAELLNELARDWSRLP